MTKKANAGMTARALLLHPGELQKEIFDKEARAFELRALAEKCTTLLSPVAGGGHDDRRMENLIAQIDALEKEKADLEMQKQQAVDEISSILILLPKAHQAVFLAEHYLQLRSIAQMAKDHTVSTRHICRRLRQAYIQYELIYDSRGKNI